MNPKRIVLLVVFGGMIGLLCLTVYFWATPQNRIYPEGVLVSGRLFTLQYALTDEEQSLGLGGRDALCETCAMAFPFFWSGQHAFWMQGMRFPLDIVWLSHHTVVHIERRIPPESGEIYRSSVPASQVLEFNAGALDGVRVGDELQFLSSIPTE